jgi:hypothetical protein
MGPGAKGHARGVDGRRLACLVHGREFRHRGIEAEKAVERQRGGARNGDPATERRVAGVAEGHDCIQSVQAAAQDDDQKPGIGRGAGLGELGRHGPGEEARRQPERGAARDDQTGLLAAGRGGNFEAPVDIIVIVGQDRHLRRNSGVMNKVPRPRRTSGHRPIALSEAGEMAPGKRFAARSRGARPA